MSKDAADSPWGSPGRAAPSRADRARRAASAGCVKLHIFVPSGREIWTVVGRGAEHWQSPHLGFCTCSGFYFDRVNIQRSCYHLEAIRLALGDGAVETIRFGDDEFGGFVAGLILLLQQAEE